jgi:hypothetical protein
MYVVRAMSNEIEEKPAFEIVDDKRNGLRIYASGRIEGELPPPNGPRIIINRIPQLLQEEHIAGRLAPKGDSW